MTTQARKDDAATEPTLGSHEPNYCHISASKVAEF
ncbi:hypothetical protein SBBP2_670015 [Burkholderiales bacterium]|nr:hypothetical protein SBBP2_670015 [Burkholderiales bacterium]